MKQNTAVMKDVAKHSAIFGIGNLLQQGVSLILLPLYVSRISTEEYGIMNLLLIGANMIGLISKSAIAPAIFRSYYDYEVRSQQKMVITTAMNYVFICSLILTISGCFFSKQISWLLTGDNSHSILTQVILITAGLVSLNDVALTVFRVKKLSKKYIIISVSQLTVSLVLIIILVLGKDMGILGVVLGRLVGAFVATLLSLYTIRSELTGRVSLQELKKMLKYGIPHIPENIIAFFANSGSRLILRVIVGPVGVGIYSIGYRIASVIQSLIITPFNMIAPATIFSMEKREEAREFYGQLFFNYIFITTFLAVLASVLAQPVLLLIARPDYHSAWKVVPFIAFGLIVYGARGLVSLPLLLKRKTYWFPIAFACGAIVNIGGLLLIAPKYGFIGAGISLLLGNTVICYIRNRAATHYMKMQLFWTRILGILSINISAIFICLKIDAYSVILTLIMRLLVALMLLLGLPFLFKLVGSDDIELIKSMRNSFMARFTGVKR